MIRKVEDPSSHPQQRLYLSLLNLTFTLVSVYSLRLVGEIVSLTFAGTQVEYTLSLSLSSLHNIYKNDLSDGMMVS